MAGAPAPPPIGASLYHHGQATSSSAAASAQPGRLDKLPGAEFLEQVTDKDGWATVNAFRCLTPQVLSQINEWFKGYSRNQKLQCLLAFFHAKPVHLAKSKDTMQSIIEQACLECDEWVRALGRLLSGYPATGAIKCCQVDNEFVYRLTEVVRLEGLQHRGRPMPGYVEMLGTAEKPHKWANADDSNATPSFGRTGRATRSVLARSEADADQAMGMIVGFNDDLLSISDSSPGASGAAAATAGGVAGARSDRFGALGGGLGRQAQPSSSSDWASLAAAQVHSAGAASGLLAPSASSGSAVSVPGTKAPISVAALMGAAASSGSSSRQQQKSAALDWDLDGLEAAERAAGIPVVSPLIQMPLDEQAGSSRQASQSSRVSSARPSTARDAGGGTETGSAAFGGSGSRTGGDDDDISLTPTDDSGDEQLAKRQKMIFGESDSEDTKDAPEPEVKNQGGQE